ncbi:hypothetical protein SAMN04488109_0913 [Chryseolinea serpens]|uniref:Uncharacterized protein n=1 Tax=Chryseolinea serpens TaxID=947013 RepID=A0A1M5KYI2_9BACT|nr:hypothetical protein [Chryseolinea serpens]SHG57821.1 hypothetical protein SAMN04488109_0913 [Chryseolinea serpens]
MKRFLKKLILFIAPFSLLLFPLGVLMYSKEVFLNVKSVTRSEEKYVFGLAYSEIGRQFKFLNVQERERFDILALGSSRVMQFRKEMFLQRFYNAGGAVQNMEEYESFLRALPTGKLPRLIILGLDQWMFNVDYRNNYKNPADGQSWTDVTAVDKNVHEKVKTFVVDVFQGKVKNILALPGYKVYGVNAVSETNGFRNDGSYFYNGAVQKLVAHDTSYRDFAFKETMSRISKGCCRFNYGDALDAAALDTLNSLLAFCKAQQIEVIAFLPPFAPTVFQKMKDLGKYGYLKMIYPQISPVFEKYGYEVYDFSDAMALGSLEGEGMVDGFHGGEVVYSSILVSMIEQGSRIRAYTDLQQIKADLKGAENSFIVYKY